MFKVQTNKDVLSNNSIASTDNSHCISKIKTYLIVNKNKAIGIAANQLFMNNRVFGMWYDNKIVVFENPRITYYNGKQSSIEGCMSIKNGKTKYVINRPLEITIESDNQEEITFKDYYATVVAHEMDHLSGKLISDDGALLNN
tara:strand:+ start:2720 stop:3148 length:429 start_codon:yes stop_codon:yes gene_type:complete